MATRGKSTPAALFPPLALALVLTLIVVNKVGSPQFTTWLAAPVILGLLVRGRAWWFPAVLGLVIAALTQVIYPHLYEFLLVADPVMVLVLTVRNALEVVLLGWTVWQIRMCGTPRERAAPERALPAPRLPLTLPPPEPLPPTPDQKE